MRNVTAKKHKSVWCWVNLMVVLVLVVDVPYVDGYSLGNQEDPSVDYTLVNAANTKSPVAGSLTKPSKKNVVPEIDATPYGSTHNPTLSKSRDVLDGKLNHLEDSSEITLARNHPELMPANVDVPSKSTLNYENYSDQISDHRTTDNEDYNQNHSMTNRHPERAGVNDDIVPQNPSLSGNRNVKGNAQPVDDIPAVPSYNSHPMNDHFPQLPLFTNNPMFPPPQSSSSFGGNEPNLSNDSTKERTNRPIGDDYPKIHSNDNGGNPNKNVMVGNPNGAAPPAEVFDHSEVVDPPRMPSMTMQGPLADGDLSLPLTMCTNAEFQCVSDHQCIPRAWVCDTLRRKDCSDGSDESPKQCPDASCLASEYRCNSGKCIPEKWRCDGEQDCEDGEDEDQNKCRALECESDQFTCHITSNHSRHCIPLNWVCDGEGDCSGGSDEQSCNATCTSEQFTCKSGKCISSRWHCDGDPDCGVDDQSDEADCPATTCTGSKVACGDGTCVNQSWFCDGELDCRNGFDEQNCSSSSSLQLSCPHDQVACPKEATCLKKEYLCDGDKDCASGWDERDELCLVPAPCSPDQYLCLGSRTCIAAALRCNGFTECVHGEDELDCPVSACDNSTDFECGNGVQCIPSTSVCDGEPDCGDASDEKNCGVNECALQNVGCEHSCVDLPAGYRCECYQGYYLVGNGHCQDIDECLEPGVCSQVCRNLPGSHKCECVNGYSRDPHDLSRCKAMEGHASLLFAHNTDIRKISLDHKEVTAIVKETRGSTALDFVFKTGMIFWTDMRDKCIYKAPIDEGNKKVVVVTNDVTNSDGLAVDWIYNHLYWTNTDRNTIELSDFNGQMRKTLINSSMDEPRAIAIYPLEGWMFWTDWGINPKIEKAGMDGTHRQDVITERIKWPNALTLDFVLRKLYWGDSKEHGIFCADFDGRNRRTVIQSAEILPHPFSITVFEDNLYWTDWTREAILTANKFTGANVTVIAHLHIPMTVHVYHSYRQPNGTNYCIPMNGQCSHLCLPAPQVSARSLKTTCACPDGMELLPDELICQKIGTPASSSPSTPDSSVYGASSDSARGRDPASSTPNSGDASVVVVAVLASIMMLLVASLMSYLIYRYLRKRSIHSMNFDNPVYKKSTGGSSSNPPPNPHFAPLPSPNPHFSPSNHQFSSSTGGGGSGGYNNGSTSSASMEDSFHLVASQQSGGSSTTGGSNNTSHSSFGGGGTSTFSSSNSSNSTQDRRAGRVQYGVQPTDECLQPLTRSNSTGGLMS